MLVAFRMNNYISGGHVALFDFAEGSSEKVTGQCKTKTTISRDAITEKTDRMRSSSTTVACTRNAAMNRQNGHRNLSLITAEDRSELSCKTSVNLPRKSRKTILSTMNESDVADPSFSKKRKIKGSLKNGIQKLFLSSLKKTPSQNARRRKSGPYASAKAQKAAHPTKRAQNQALWFLAQKCPEDIVPNVLAFVGLKTITTLAKVNDQWNAIVNQDANWKIMSEVTYKWQQGDELPNTTWKEFYLQNPCVPVDYRTIPKALAAIKKSRASGTIFLCPGLHFLRDTLEIDFDPSIQIRIKSLAPPAAYFKQRRLGIYDWSETRATLSRETYARNQPLMQIKQGHVVVEDVFMYHQCCGTNLWGGNSVVHIDPTAKSSDSKRLAATAAQQSPTASLRLENVDLTSASGRGIVAVGGARVHLNRTYLHECAATGLYLGGPDTQARVEKSDIVGNGRGIMFGHDSLSTSSPTSSVPSGHSGIFLVDGKLDLIDSNVAWNFGSGVSQMEAEGSLIATPATVSVCPDTTIADNAGNGIFPDDSEYVHPVGVRVTPRTRTTLLRQDSSFDGPRIMATVAAAAAPTPNPVAWYQNDHSQWI